MEVRGCKGRGSITALEYLAMHQISRGRLRSRFEYSLNRIVFSCEVESQLSLQKVAGTVSPVSSVCF